MDQIQGVFPISTFSLKVVPNDFALVNDISGNTVIRVTMAAIDIASSKSTEATVLKMITRPKFSEEDDSDDSDDDIDESDLEEDLKIASRKKKQQTKANSNNEDSNGSEDEDENEYENVSVICTLSPKTCFQQPIDIYLTPNEEVLLTAEGPHNIYISGNYVSHPYDDEDDEDDEDDFNPADYLDEDEYDLSPDEDELDISNSRIEELDDSQEDEELVKKSLSTKHSKKEDRESKSLKKRNAEETELYSKKEGNEKIKKQKKNEEKKVAFSKELEQGPTPSEPSLSNSFAKTLPGGIVIEDKKTGSGAACKKGNKVSVRYIGKLQNGSTFDSNTSGKPFQFKLGAGEVIKGWDIGVAGMSLKGERRIIIPAPMAYGNKKLPGIPANSTLVFDVKLVGIK